MQISLNDYGKDYNITITEYLEPQGAVYSIKQNDNVINISNEYQAEELARALNFLIGKD